MTATAKAALEVVKPETGDLQNADSPDDCFRRLIIYQLEKR